MKRLSMIIAGFACAISLFAQKSYTITSPDGSICSQVTVGKELTYDISKDGVQILAPSPLSLSIQDGTVWGHDSKVRKASKGSVNNTVPMLFYRASEVVDNYNYLTLKMKGDWSVEFRVYNDGVAYRFASTSTKPYVIQDEQVEYIFNEDYDVILPYNNVKGKDVDPLWTSFENTYTTSLISEVDPKQYAFLPLSVDAGAARICVTETDLYNYPGMFIVNRKGGKSLQGYFAHYPKTIEQGGHNRLQMIVGEREDFIAKVDAPRTFPWRIAIVGNDVQIASSNLSYLLAAPSKIEDPSWIKPGKVAWEWWNDLNISGVDFKAGVNNETYKYYIDFASEHGVEYVILDEGWAVNLQADLMQIVPEIDLEGLVKYADAKGVGLILWAGYYAFERDMENVCRHYSEMGIKGFKVDFMDRDDQLMTEFNHRAAEVAAKYHLVLDLHGSHKPAGIHRTWPNVLNCEGVFGLEQMKWAVEGTDHMKYDTQVPFLRQVGGPLDYTQGAMLNANKKNFRSIHGEPMSQGTRCHQLALYMIFDSPLNMLCDSPTHYMAEPECTEFIASVPTYWDETRVLSGELGEYVVTARRSGDTWFIGGITCWTPRTLEVDLSLLGISEGTEIEVFKDGVNADRKATDYAKSVVKYDGKSSLKLHLAPGGGFAIKTN